MFFIEEALKFYLFVDGTNFEIKAPKPKPCSIAAWMV